MRHRDHREVHEAGDAECDEHLPIRKRQELPPFFVIARRRAVLRETRVQNGHRILVALQFTQG